MWIAVRRTEEAKTWLAPAVFSWAALLLPACASPSPDSPPAPAAAATEIGSDAPGSGTVEREESEPIGEAQENLSPFSVFCALFTLGLGISFHRVVCTVPSADNPGACRNVADYGFGGLSLACLFL